ncbi:beta-galactosidase [Enterococcus thailandicus]|uniref:glycoside hydrolase family 35 protein n=1 Tax=Enterococcus thailandicus TaxID=417368 RepID=UPI0022EBF29B|nr:beta-galactosidase family protein [Enterococcus thailandicus]MDA3973860.1 beta-galactosidase [Enterococcus thailandicus]MDA3976327.1 beta-galactosidase [Enterococcus thailandicus]MDA3981292.1 beta-galactosidase [Enterococcus thailandicus]
MNFEVKEEFYVDGQPIKLISGAVHYFRIAPTHWRQTLQNLQAMGCNCVETYIPWNLHEPQKGTFDFTGIANVTKFLDIAEELGLYIIVRPSPYICAEWDFGGLPAWLLADPSMRIRSQHSGYLQAVKEYYHVLLPKLAPYQVTRGGHLLLVQVENEYGSYGEDKMYLKFLAEELRRYFDVPLVTSDGGWEEVLEAGTLPQEGILATANFGSDANENFKWLQNYQEKNGLKEPYMCMEFWDGWFNSWGKPIIRRDPQETAEEVRQVLKKGSINFYMFQGGTNFGFYNGCSDAGATNEPQITSYDYDAPLTEWGMPTEKYFAIQKVIQEEVPTAKISTPVYPETIYLGSYAVKESVSLFSVLEEISEPIVNDYTLPMEKIGQNFGYTLYRSQLLNKRHIAKMKVVDGLDRVQFFMNQQLITTQYQAELGQEFACELTKEQNELSLLVENMGRNNYGPKLVADSQRKGIRSGVMEDIHYISDWEHYPLELQPEQLEKIDFTKATIAKTPSFYKIELLLEEVGNTFLDCSSFGKGVVFVNGENIGRYWQEGPTQSLFIPDFFWKKGINEVIIFETEGVPIYEIHFSEAPIMA